MAETTPEPDAEVFVEEIDDVWVEETSGPSLVARMLAEAAGTFILVAMGVGTAVTLGFVTSGTLVIQGQNAGSVVGSPTVVVGLAFGVGVIIAASAFAWVSGAHLNPAITVGAWLAGRMPGRDVAPYILAQLVGGVAAGTTMFLLVQSHPSVTDGQQMMVGAANGWGDYSPSGFGIGAALAVEIIATALLVLTVLGATSRKSTGATAPFAIGLALALLLVWAIPFTNGALNPARATAAAVFAGSGPLSQLWLFWVAPLVGAAIVGLAYRAFGPAEDLETVEVIEVVED